MNRVLKNEQAWMDWKDKGCPTFEKHLSNSQKACFKQNTAFPLNSIQTRINRNNQIKIWLGTDRRNDVFDIGRDVL